MLEGKYSKIPSTSVLQHLCNAFHSCVQHSLLLPRNSNIVSKVLRGKMLPLWSHISEAKEKTQWLNNANNNPISLQAEA